MSALVGVLSLPYTPSMETHFMSVVRAKPDIGPKQMLNLPPQYPFLGPRSHLERTFRGGPVGNSGVLYMTP